MSLGVSLTIIVYLNRYVRRLATRIIIITVDICGRPVFQKVFRVTDLLGTTANGISVWYTLCV